MVKMKFSTIKQNLSFSQTITLLILFTFYVTILLCTSAVVYKFIALPKNWSTSAAVIVFPISFTIADIITELYGYKISRVIIWLGIFSQFLLTILTLILIHLPSPSSFHYNSDYIYVFGNLLTVFVAGLVASIASSFLNIYLLTKWGIILNGKYFWLRSLGSTLIGELAYTIIASVIILFHTQKSEILEFIIAILIFKIVYLLILIYPANKLTMSLKNRLKLDFSDISTNYNPFRIL